MRRFSSMLGGSHSFKSSGSHSRRNTVDDGYNRDRRADSIIPFPSLASPARASSISSSSAANRRPLPVPAEVAAGEPDSAPPAYSASSAGPARGTTDVESPSTADRPRAGSSRNNAAENPLCALARYDVVFLVGEWARMLRECKAKLTEPIPSSSSSMLPLWREARDALTGIVAKT